MKLCLTPIIFLALSLLGVSDLSIVPVDLDDAAIYQKSYRDEKNNWIVEEVKIDGDRLKNLDLWFEKQEKGKMLTQFGEEKVPFYIHGEDESVAIASAQLPIYMITRFNGGKAKYKLRFWPNPINGAISIEIRGLLKILKSKPFRKYLLIDETEVEDEVK